MMERIQHFGKTLYYEGTQSLHANGHIIYIIGDLGYFESVNKETLKNAFQRYQHMGLLASHSVVAKPAFEADTQDPHGNPASKRPIQNITVFYVDTKLENQALRFLSKEPRDLYRQIYSYNKASSKTSNKISSGTEPTIYKTKLWELVETIGKYRREGKHRRDNETTGTHRIFCPPNPVRKADVTHCWNGQGYF